jgi:hypothetical protein
MNSFYLFFAITLVLSLSNCARKPVLPPDLIFLENLISYVKNDDVQKAEVIIELVRFMASEGFAEGTTSLITQITDYRSALAKLAVWSELVKRGQNSQVRGDLLRNSKLPSAGVGLQESEIIVQMLSLADATHCLENLTECWKREKRELPPYIAANVLPNYVRNGKRPAAIGALKTALKVNATREADPTEAVEQRMVWRSTSQGLSFEVEGLIQSQKMNEARDLLKPFFTVGKELPASNLSQGSHLLLLAYRCGLQDEVIHKVPQLIEQAESFPPGWIDSFKDLGSLFALLGELGMKDQIPRLVDGCLKKQTNNIEPYFLMLGKAQLAEGCWAGGQKELAFRLWRESIDTAQKTPNPRSQVVGVFEVWLGFQRSHAPIPDDIRAKTLQWLETVNQAYADIGL